MNMVATNTQDDLVPLEDGCPMCGERHTDLLVWDESGEWVRCESCGALYKPGGDHDQA